jgi:hypothetical protein
MGAATPSIVFCKSRLEAATEGAATEPGGAAVEGAATEAGGAPPASGDAMPSIVFFASSFPGWAVGPLGAGAAGPAMPSERLGIECPQTPQKAASAWFGAPHCGQKGMTGAF